jgi:PRC-barrel domain protein
MFPQELLPIFIVESSAGAAEAPSSPHRRVHTSQMQPCGKCKMENGKMATRTQERPLDKRETSNLIGSDKVEGTPVYRLNGDNIGRIERVMIDKISGKVAYAVMSFGGFLGIGEDYYPLPWSVLTYNPTLGGYEVEITEQQLKNAPRYSRHETWDWADRQRTQKLTDYYGTLG